ncbi:MAG: hypothetical protein NVS3B20_24220 [Polyangiales bacterium]
MAFAVLVVCAATPARADEASDYEQGRSLYANSKHVEADLWFAKAIDGPSASIKDPVLMAKGRMIRGAADMSIGRKSDAVTQFELILRTTPKFEPDPLAFPSGVLDEFRRTRERIEKETVSKSKDEQLKKEIASRDADIAGLREKLDSLKSYAREERVVTKHSRLIATIPFGVGQFQNGETALGVLFATSEVIALGTAAVSFGIHESIPSHPAESDLARAKSIETSSRAANWVSSAAFFAIAVGGVVQAHLAYLPDAATSQPRALPSTFSRVVPIVAPTPGGGVLGLVGAF